MVSRHDKNHDLRLIHNIGYGPPLTYGEEPIVWNEAILDEHWDQLGDALSGDELVTDIYNIIQLENVEMKKERLAILVAMFVSGRANSSSTYIQFNNANLCAEGIISLSKLVDFSSQLHQLIIAHSRIDNINSALCLSRPLRSHACINELD